MFLLNTQVLSQKLFPKSRLIQNSFSLMLGTAATALFGFIFWTVVARSFHPATVGLATTLLSMTALLSLLGLVGFDTIFMRFLSHSDKRNELITSGMAVTGLASAIIAGIFCALIPMLSPKLVFVNHHPAYIALFIAVTVLTAWNTLTNAILVGYRRASFVLGINVAFSLVKMCLPFVVHSGGAMTIVAFMGFAQIVNVALSVGVLMKYFGYMPTIRVNLSVLKGVQRYGSAVYVANILNLLPDSALPLIVIDKLGASAAAYFYVAFTIANLLYTIVFASTQSLFAEASHDEQHWIEHVRKSLIVITGLIIPATVVLLVVCPIALTFFGPSYSSGATAILRILSISSLPIMLYSILGVIFRLMHSLKANFVMAAVNAAAIVVIGIVVAKPWGISGVGWAWFIGNWVSVGAGVLFLARRTHSRAVTDHVALRG